ncbi:MAG TPA: ATP-binding protein, partial [Holophagaceae bacterium]
THYVAIKEDITERKRAEQERRELEAQIQQAQKLESLGSLAGGLAHDMNNVLGAILGLASMLREKSGETEGKALDTIVQACMRGRGVVKSLLYFARKDLQEERAIDLNALAEEMAQLLSHTTLKRVDLTLELQPSLPQIRGDGGALSHVLMNLCVNALDAMPAGGSLRIQTASLEKGGVELRVRDTGEGMTPEVLARCLEPFYTTKPRGKGTGLGLPMVHSTMVAHEGEFLLRSTPGEGTEAILRFPASRTLASAGPEAVEPVSPSAPSPSLDVLLVDDDDLVRESVTELIGLLGHRGVAVGGGQEALDRLERGQAVDLVILDMNMPGMSGAQVLPRLLALRPSLPVILATGYSHEDMTPLLIGRPNVRSLSKPFTALELKAKIDELDIHPSENRG